MSRLPVSVASVLLVIGSSGWSWSQDSWGPTGGVLSQQIAETMQQDRPGSRSVTVGLLRELAAAAQKSRQVEAWAWAQTGMAEQLLEAEKEELEFIDTDPVEVLEELINRCDQDRIVGPLARALSAHAGCLSQLGRMMLAAQEWERAGCLAMDANQTARSLTFFLCAARVYRNEGHAAKVSESQSWLDAIERERGPEIGEDGRRAIAKFRDSAAGLLKLTQTPEAAGSPAILLQPTNSGVVVSSSENERGRCRFTLANHSTRAVSGLLTLSAARGNVTVWQNNIGATNVILRPDPKPGAEVQRVRLLPGEKRKVFIDYRFAGENTDFADTLRMSWTDAETSQDAEAHFHFASGPVPVSQITNASTLVRQSRWPTPFYHELYYRGQILQVENLLATTSNPARMEIYNEDTGELIAIDAEGDGRYDGANDFLEQANSSSENAWPRLIVGPKNPVGSLEIYVFPLDKSSASTLLTLSLADYTATPARWRQDKVDELLIK